MPDQLIRAIYANAAQPGQLTKIMAGLEHAFQAQSSFLFTSHSLESPDSMLIGHNMCPDAVDDFAGKWCQEDVWAHAAAEHGLMKREVVLTGDELVAKEVLHRSTFYNEYGKNAGMDGMLGSVLFDGSERGGDIPFTNLCWYRAPGQPRFGDAEKVLLRSVLRHLQQALLLHHQYDKLFMQHMLAGVSAAGNHLAALVLDASAKIAARNHDTESLVTGEPPLVRTMAERITALGRRCIPTLAHALGSCRSNGRAVRLLIQAHTTDTLLTATLSALPTEQSTVVGEFSQSRYLLIVELPREINVDMIHQASEMYDFTLSETAVALALISGLTVEQVASKRGSSINTVRTQVRALLHKTGYQRQVDMIRMLCQLVR